MRTIPLLLLLSAFPLAAAHIGYLYPAGGQRGTTIELVIGGQRLNNPTLDITGGGVKVLSIERVPGMPRPDGKQNKYLLSWIKNIEKGDRTRPPMPENTEGWRKCEWWNRLDTLTPLQYELVTRDLFTPPNPLQMSPAIREQVIATLAIAPDAAPGEREIRINSYGNLSNPAKFIIDDLPAGNEPRFPVPPAVKTPPEVRLPAVVNGQILPGETDYFRMAMKKGEQWTFTMTARHLLPFIGDAVPGHFQGLIRLVNPAGKEAAFADDEYFNPDPTLRFTVPEDGIYTLEVRDALYRGREDFVYRVAIRPGLAPYAFTPPPEGKNLQSGVLAKPGAEAWYELDLKPGETVVAEVFARRCNSPLDSLLQLYGPDGKIVAENDDNPHPLVGEIVQDADSLIRYTAPAAGRYRLRLTDRGGNSGADYRYSLRIGAPEPGFRLYFAPSAVMAYQYDHTPILVKVDRLDGFDGEIKLATDAKFYRFSGSAVIPAGASEALVTLTPVPGKRPRIERINVTGSAPGIASCRAVPCDEAMQAFAYTHFVPAQEFLVSDRGNRHVLRDAKIPDAPVRLAPGKSVRQEASLPNLPRNAVLTATLRGAPAALTVTHTDGTRLPTAAWTITAAPDAKPGRWSTVTEFAAEIPVPPGKDGKPRKPRKESFSFPATLIEVR